MSAHICASSIMLEPDHLDPYDVLNHLNDLGFQNVTAQQLNDFIHDLKKLIKYEQHLSRRGFRPQPLCAQMDHTDFCHCTDQESDLQSGEVTSCHSCSQSASDSSHNSYPSVPQKSQTRSSQTTDSGNLQKLPSSFIRPWNLPSTGDNSFKNRKNLDPVSLYHHYKKIWKNNKIPGQSNHSQLRWTIRNKMLGQEPQSRGVVSTINLK